MVQVLLGELVDVSLAIVVDVAKEEELNIVVFYYGFLGLSQVDIERNYFIVNPVVEGQVVVVGKMVCHIPYS